MNKAPGITPSIVEYAELNKVQMEEAIKVYLEIQGFDVEKFKIEWKVTLPSDTGLPIIRVPVERRPSS